MHTQVTQSHGVSHCVHGFEAIEEFEHGNGLIEGIGYRNGLLVRYSAGSLTASPFECAPISVAEALHWWAELQADDEAYSTAWMPDARARFLEKAAQALAAPSA